MSKRSAPDPAQGTTPHDSVQGDPTYYAPPVLRGEAGGLRIHMLFPHVAWYDAGDEKRLAMLGTYVRAVVNEPVASREIIVVPAGFQRAAPEQAIPAIRAACPSACGRDVLLSGGIDLPDKQYSYLVELAKPSGDLAVKKFNGSRLLDKGDREDPRSYRWGAVEAFSLCCFDACCGRGGRPPASLRWSMDADLNVITVNAHYHGNPDIGGFEVSNAGALAAGVGRIVSLSNHLQGLGVVCFFTDSPPFSGKWWYATHHTYSRISTKDYSSGTGSHCVWHRVLTII